MAEQLGVSRTTVWKHLARLQEWGVAINKIKGHGYQIPGGIELLSDKLIRELLPAKSRRLLAELMLLDEIDSTNTAVRKKIEQGAGSGLVCLAERQTQGRGRLGRNWVSPYGRNLYMSASWEFTQGVSALEGLSLAVGVAVCRAVGRLGVDNLALKWPNDVLLAGKKVGGVLLEMLGDPVGPCQVVVGVGLNLAMPDDIAIDQPWADLEGHAMVTRNGLAGAVLSELLPMLSTYSGRGFSQYRAAWEGYDAHRDARVRLSTPRSTVEGIARGVSDSGALCLEIDDKHHFFTGGEISLRRLA